MACRSKSFVRWNAHSWRSVCAFTLVELMVVISCIVILAALLLPALASAKDSGRKATCISNLRQIGIAIHAYAQEGEAQMEFPAPRFAAKAASDPAITDD